MAKSKKQKMTWQQYIAAVISLLALIVFGSWYYFDQVHLKPVNVFWGAIDQSLQTASVTRNVYNASEVQSYSQSTKMQFKAQLASHTVIKIINTLPGNESTIVTEIIGTPAADYLKYSQIDSANDSVPEGTVGIWASNQASDTQMVDILSNDLLATPLIFGYLGHNQRTELVDSIRDNNVFEVDFDTVDTSGEFEGKKVYSYDVTIHLASYFSAYQKYLQMIGQNELAEQLGVPIVDTPIAMTLTIDPMSYQIRQMVLGDYDTTITFTNYDVSQMIQIPDASMTINELQQLLLG